jgi:hypothetical protein
MSTARPLRFARFAGVPVRRCHFFYLAAGCGLTKALYLAVMISFCAALIFSCPALIYSQPRTSSGRVDTTLNNFGSNEVIREQIPKQFCERYKRWKATFLSVETGRRLWLRYAANPAFRLTIIVSKSVGQGAKVDDLQWEEGRLAAATITLGHQLDYGYPGRIDYPVLGSIPFVKTRWNERADDVLAAAKIAHEFGHVDQAANMDAATYQLQNDLSSVYSSHLLLNGHNADDPILVELASRMGGTPPEIKQQREYGAEIFSLRYLLSKLGANRCRELLRQVRKFLESEPARYSFASQIQLKALASSD